MNKPISILKLVPLSTFQMEKSFMSLEAPTTPDLFGANWLPDIINRIILCTCQISSAGSYCGTFAIQATRSAGPSWWNRPPRDPMAGAHVDVRVHVCQVGLTTASYARISFGPRGAILHAGPSGGQIRPNSAIIQYVITATGPVRGLRSGDEQRGGRRPISQMCLPAPLPAPSAAPRFAHRL